MNEKWDSRTHCSKNLSGDHASELQPKGAKLRPPRSSRVSQSLIPNYPFRYVRGESPHRGIAPAGTEGKAPGTAVASVGGAASTAGRTGYPRGIAQQTLA